jgi:hypothetical protein
MIAASLSICSFKYLSNLTKLIVMMPVNQAPNTFRYLYKKRFVAEM